MCCTSSEENEPHQPKIILDETTNSELNELLTEINESAYKLPESPSKQRQYIESEMRHFVIETNFELPDIVTIYNFIK